MRLCLPESPSWLSANGRSEEVKALLVKCHAKGNEDDKLAKLEFIQMRTSKQSLFNENHNTTAGKPVVAMLSLFYFFYNLAFNPLLCSYYVEILQYPILAKSFSLLMFFGNVLAWKLYIVYVAWLAAELAVSYHGVKDESQD
ncbi:hexose transporter [Fusarium denticulatum]|uniref:Hexose transporter n=1 Tax=Fusarium denticulatum TaxID=48507 RepID=A0A8H5TUC4_9HYPO|nr:hexose transporter [Fusarium denticulatum]